MMSMSCNKTKKKRARTDCLRNVIYFNSFNITVGDKQIKFSDKYALATKINYMNKNKDTVS